MRKSKLALNEWARELAPSAELRKAFGHDPAKWKFFQATYLLELRAPAARRKLEELARRACKDHGLTLVYSARPRGRAGAFPSLARPGLSAPAIRTRPSVAGPGRFRYAAFLPPRSQTLSVMH